ncbi:hypothetical protein LINPERHAP1_LOCUS34741, partial [Linum perenne]
LNLNHKNPILEIFPAATSPADFLSRIGASFRSRVWSRVAAVGGGTTSKAAPSFWFDGDDVSASQSLPVVYDGNDGSASPSSP